MTLFDINPNETPAIMPNQQELFDAGLWQQKTNLSLTGDTCHRCKVVILRGEDTHGITRRLDAAALDPTGELTAVLTARLTYRLWTPAPRTLTATRRWAADITTHPASPTATPAHLRSGPTGTPALVVATHRCGQPLSAHPLPLAPAGDHTALPDQPTF